MTLMHLLEMLTIAISPHSDWWRRCPGLFQIPFIIICKISIFPFYQITVLSKYSTDNTQCDIFIVVWGTICNMTFSGMYFYDRFAISMYRYCWSRIYCNCISARNDWEPFLICLYMRFPYLHYQFPLQIFILLI